MFLALLNGAEKRAFVQLADHLAAADDVILEAEKQAISALKAEAGIPGATGENLLPVDELASVFVSRRAKIAALLELLGLAYADSEFEANERSMIVATAHEMDIEMAELRQLEDWVRDHIKLVERALAIMNE